MRRGASLAPLVRCRAPNVKPNILLTNARGGIKISDFSLSRILYDGSIERLLVPITAGATIYYNPNLSSGCFLCGQERRRVIQRRRTSWTACASSSCTNSIEGSEGVHERGIIVGWVI